MKKVLMIILICLWCLQGCAYERPTGLPEKEPSASPAGTDSIDDYEVTEISLFEELTLDQEEKIEILDREGRSLLLCVYIPYDGHTLATPTTSRAIFTAQGENKFAQRLVTYDLDTQVTTTVCTFSKDLLCNAASFCGKKIAYVVIYPSDSEYNEYEIYWNEDGESKRIVSGVCSYWSFLPELAVLENSCLAYTYSDPREGSFGVNMIQPDGTIRKDIRFEEEREDVVANRFHSNGNYYIYFAGVHSLGTFFIGDKESVKYQFSLQQNERIFSYALLEDELLLSIEKYTTEGGRPSQYLLVKDFNGDTVEETELGIPIYRLTSDCNNLAMGIGPSYELYLLDFSALQIEKTAISPESLPEYGGLSLLSNEDGRFLIHCRGSSYENQLFELKR